MKLVFLGPPGAGKGTLAADASKSLGVPHISTGDIFRTAVKEGTPLGVKVKSILDSGGLVPDELTIDLVRERLSRPDASKGWILDGFPRTIPQADALETIMKPDKVVNLAVEDEIVIRRLSGRRTCSSCGKIYHVETMPPKTEGICDACGGKLIVRDDDRVEAITNRLTAYRAQTSPLIEYYRALGRIVDIDARDAPKIVLSRFLDAFGIK